MIGGEMGYLSFFELDNQLQSQNTLNFQIKIFHKENARIS